MNDSYNVKLEQIMGKIDWDSIQDYHEKLNILWDIENNKGAIEPRVPTVNDIQSELSALITYMFDNRIDYLAYGNWVIFCDEETPDYEVRVIFRLADYVFKDNDAEENYTPFPYDKTSLVRDLSSKLDCAVKDEDYELAAYLRDEIRSIDKKD